MKPKKAHLPETGRALVYVIANNKHIGRSVGIAVKSPGISAALLCISGLKKRFARREKVKEITGIYYFQEKRVSNFSFLLRSQKGANRFKPLSNADKISKKGFTGATRVIEIIRLHCESFIRFGMIPCFIPNVLNENNEVFHQ